MIHQGVE